MRCLLLSVALAAAAGPSLAQNRLPPPPSASAEPQMKTSDEIKRESLEGAATAPLRDLNILRAKIPDVLHQAMADPYARPPRNYRCPQLMGLITPLDEALGPDIDLIRVEDDDMLERGRQTALGVAAGLASDAIPFRGWVRWLSGAERHDRLVRDAIISGAVRRAYLKGLGEARGCSPPATPSHERAAMPVQTIPGEQPDGGRFSPRFPTRQPVDAPRTPPGTPRAAPRR